MSRRARISPSSTGLPASATPRRGKGLRREEVAALAGVSVDYYARLEQGRIGTVSDQILTAIEDVLGLTPLEREHLRALVSTERARTRQKAPPTVRARGNLRSLITAMDPIPVILQGPRMEVLAWNSAATVLLADFGAMAPQDRNIARWLFLDPSTRTKYPDWEEVAAPTVAALRAARDPRRPDEALERLVGELSVASEDFARFWAGYRLFKHGHGAKRIFHETVGTMTLNYETLDVPDSGGQFFSIYTADVGSPSAEKLQILLSWNETVNAGRSIDRRPHRERGRSGDPDRRRSSG
ncbi:helix-turn-helix transcriptional regulator [Umezawaea sp. NPDC059074]|uniref:helix-turn-helix transcriptional regulator n=1 Tax=Umezawaea sp. NPDC059074 TaxID=3346716 RepID=UPI0036804557